MGRKRTGRNFFGKFLSARGARDFSRDKRHGSESRSRLPILKEHRSLGIFVDLFFSPATVLHGPSRME